MPALWTIRRLSLLYFSHYPQSQALLVKQVAACGLHHDGLVEEVFEADRTDVLILRSRALGSTRACGVWIEVFDLIDHIIAIFPFLFPLLKLFECGRLALFIQNPL